MRDAGNDTGKLHALEALFVGTMFFAAAGFVLTFEETSTPDAPAADTLNRRGEDALATFYDKPLDNPMYGNNTMSKRLAQSLSGTTGPLSDQLNATLPSHTLYNLFLSNGYAKQPVYEQFTPSPSTPTPTVSRLIEPEWSYIFTSTNFAKYPEDPGVQPTKMGLYTLPVSSGTSVRTGGAEVDVVVHGNLENPNLDEDSSFRLDRSFTVRQAGSGNAIPHASMYFNSSDDDPKGFAAMAEEFDRDANVGADCETGCTSWWNLTINETAGEPIPAGMKVNITVPRGWTADSSGGTGYSLVSAKDDPDHRGDLVLELDSAISDEVRTLKFNATYHEDQYEYYTFHARMHEPVFGDAELVVRAEDQTGGYTGGDFPHPRVSAPRSMGSSEKGTWVMAVVNPESLLSTDTGLDEIDSNSTLHIHNVTITQPEGKALFESVSEVKGVGACSGSWSKISGSKLKWTPSSNCGVNAGGGVEFAAKVQSNPETETDLTLTPRFHPSAVYDDGFEMNVSRPFTDAFPRQFVPPDTQGAASSTHYPGFPNGTNNELPSTGSYGIDTDSVHGSTLLKGEGSYKTIDSTNINTYQVALGLGSVNAEEPRVAIGETATIDINVESILFALSKQGVATQVETNIYPPWSMGQRDPILSRDHVEEDLKEIRVNWTFHEDIDDDGDEDIVGITKGTTVYGLEGTTGAKLAGYQLKWDKVATSAVEFELDSTTTAFAIGFKDGTAKLVNEDFEVLWDRQIRSNQPVEDLTADYDWDGGGKTDIVAGSKGNSYFTWGEQRSLTQNKTQTISASLGGPTKVQGADLLDDAAGASETVISKGKGAAVKVVGHQISTEGVFYSEDTNKLKEEVVDVDKEVLQALKSPTIYRKEPVLMGYNNSMGWTDEVGTKSPIWKGSGTGGFQYADAADLNGDGSEDPFGANASIDVGDYSQDPGRIQAYNGSTTSASTSMTVAHGSTILDMATPTRSHAYYITDDGLLEFTYDAWNTRHYYTIQGQPLEQFPTARSIEFVNKSHGWMVGSHDDIWYTVNMSRHWTHMADYDIVNRLGVSLSLDEVDLQYNDLHINESEYGVIVGGNCADESTCTDPWIAWTDDGGHNWKKADVESNLITNDFRFMDVHFPTNETGYAVGTKGMIYKTTDAGDTWDKMSVSSLKLLDTDARPDLQAVYFLNATHGFVAGEDETLMRTTDGGSTWHNVTVIHPVKPQDYQPDLYDIAFATEKEGYVAGEDGALYRTNDGGQRWVPSTPQVPADMAGDVEYRTVETPTKHVGYAAGSENEGGDRFWNIFQAYVNDTVAVSEPLEVGTWHANNGDSLAKIRAARVHPAPQTRGATNITYFVSNDGCNTWKESLKANTSVKDHRFDNVSTYEWATFDDPSKTSLCWKSVFTSDGLGNVYYRSPFLYNLTVEYEYKESGDSEWHTRNVTYELTNAAIRDEAATTAAWNVSEGTISMAYVDRLWWNRVNGSVMGVTHADMDITDDHTDVLAWTGKEPGTADCITCSSEFDNRVYAFNGETGELMRNTTKLPGPVEGLHKINLTGLTNDDVMDFVVTYETSSGDSKVRAYDGSSFSKLWTVDANGTAVSWTHGTYDSGSSVELTWGTDAPSASDQPVVETYEPDHDPAQWEWTTRPAFVGNYTVNYDVPRHALFGPYIVETSVSWDAVGGSGTQTARLFDYFSVTTPDGEVPESPIYRLELVTAYEDTG